MSVLRISLFGGVHIAHGDVLCPPPTRAVQTFLSYLLLLRRRLHSRESLVGVFWADQPEDTARNCLNTALWRLRRVLEPPGVRRGTYLITAPGGEIGFNHRSHYWLDVEELERHAGRALAPAPGALEPDAVAGLEKAVALYTGEALDGIYDDWALRERERLRTLYLNSLACLMRYHQSRGNWERGIAYGEEILRHDPLREEIHRGLMRLHAAGGARALAARQYETCQRTLATELGVEPMPETHALLRAITSGAKEMVALRGDEGTVTGLLMELRSAASIVDRALAQLRTVLGHVESALPHDPRREISSGSEGRVRPR